MSTVTEKFPSVPAVRVEEPHSRGSPAELKGKELVGTVIVPSNAQSSDEQIIVEWEEGDLDNPLNWSRGYRWYITILSSVLVFNATFASSAPSGILKPMMAHFHMSQEVSILTISLFVAGYCVGPLLWAPLSEQYGRRNVFIVTFFAYSLLQVGNALAKNVASLLILRLLGGIFAAGPLANSGGVISDIWDAKTRGKALVFFGLAPFTGPALGPTISGYFEVIGVDWRWLFWLLAIFAGACLLLIILTLPETYRPLLLARKAQRLREERHDPHYVAPFELTKFTLKEKLENILLKPFRILFSEPMLMAVTAYSSFVYGNVYLMFQAYPIVFSRDHHLNAGASGLTLLGIPVGGAIGAISYMLWIYPRYERAIEKHAPHPVPPEKQLEMAIVGAPIFAISFFWFGWTSFPQIHYVVPLLSGVSMGVGIFFLFLSLINYTIEAYLSVAASALSALVVCRSLAGAAFPLFSNQMYDALNPRWASTLLGLIAVLLMPIPFVLLKYGPRLRKNSKYSPSGPQHVETETPTETPTEVEQVRDSYDMSKTEDVDASEKV